MKREILFVGRLLILFVSFSLSCAVWITWTKHFPAQTSVATATIAACCLILASLSVDRT